MGPRQYIYAHFVASALERAMRAAEEAQRPHADVAIRVRIRPDDLERVEAADLAEPAGIQCRVRVGEDGDTAVGLGADWTLTSMRTHLEAAIERLKD
jgi:hypothetical protein